MCDADNGCLIQLNACQAAHQQVAQSAGHFGCIHIMHSRSCVMQETADLKARMEQLQTGPTPLEAAQAKRADLLADKAKFLDHIAGLEVCLSQSSRTATPLV